jgi:hypothetical protein
MRIETASSGIDPLSWTSDSQWIVDFYGSTQFIHRDGHCILTPLGDLGKHVIAVQGDIVLLSKGDKYMLNQDAELYILDLKDAFGSDFIDNLKCP